VPANPNDVARSLCDEMPLEGERLELLQHIFSGQSKKLPIGMSQQGVVPNAREMNIIRKIDGREVRYPERQYAAAGPRSALKQSIVRAAPGQIGGHPPDRGLRPSLGHLSVVDSALHNSARIFIGYFGITASISPPINSTYKVTQYWVRPACIDK